MSQVGPTNHQSCDCVCICVCVRTPGRSSLTSVARDYPSCCRTSSSSRPWCTLWRSRRASPSKTSESPARLQLRRHVRAVSQHRLLLRCALASLLTVALHNKLCYLTDVMEALLKDLMQQNRSAQPKLLLRRTEFTVEKLLTNWMSICLYGFLRVSRPPWRWPLGSVGAVL